MMRPYQEGFLLLLIILAVGVLVWLFAPFWQALFLGMILATATYSGYEAIRQRWISNSNGAALLMTAVVLFVIVLPLGYLLIKVSLQAGALYGQAQSWLVQLTPAGALAQVGQWLPVDESIQQMLLSQLQQKAGMMLEWVQQVVVGTLKVLLGSTTSFLSFIALAMFALFFFYRDGADIARHLVILSPLENSLDRLLIQRFNALSTVLTLSVLGVALLQGLSFALISWVLGLPGVFIGVAVAVASFIPVVGAALIWVPLSVYMLAQGQWVAAGLLAFWGAVVAGFLIDNLVRPWLIQKLSQRVEGAMDQPATNHTLLTVLSTLAGLIHFGVLGLFFGPVLAAMAITIFEVYERRYGVNLDRS